MRNSQLGKVEEGRQGRRERQLIFASRFFLFGLVWFFVWFLFGFTELDVCFFLFRLFCGEWTLIHYSLNK